MSDTSVRPGGRAALTPCSEFEVGDRQSLIHVVAREEIRESTRQREASESVKALPSGLPAASIAMKSLDPNNHCGFGTRGARLRLRMRLKKENTGA